MSGLVKAHRGCFSRRLGLALAVAAPLTAVGQGTIDFRNRGLDLDPDLDAPVTYLDGTRLGAGFTAQLYGGPRGTPLMSLEPWLPTTVFYSTPPERLGYIQQVVVETPLPFGAEVTVVMRVFDGVSWETSICRGESALLDLKLAGPLSGPGPLIGLQPFSVNCIPEPSAWMLAALGAGILFAVRARRPKEASSGWWRRTFLSSTRAGTGLLAGFIIGR